MTTKRTDENLPTSLTTTRPSQEPEAKTGIPTSGSGCATTHLKVIHGGTVEGQDNALLTSVTQLAGSSPVAVERRSYDEFGLESKLVGYRIEGNVPAAVQQQIRTLIAAANTPTTRSDVGPLMGAMSMAMPSHDGSDGEAWLELVWMSVEDLPADVIKEALKKIIKREKWRPTPAEIREECLWLARKRRALLRLEMGT